MVAGGPVSNILYDGNSHGSTEVTSLHSDWCNTGRRRQQNVGVEPPTFRSSLFLAVVLLFFDQLFYSK